MRKEPALTYQGALKILGKHESSAVKALDTLLGGLILAAGTTDEAVARRLGLSRRTVQRQMQQLMRRLGADSRFQAGLQAKARGWL